MNKLLELSFKKYNYDGAFLREISGADYDNHYLFNDEAALLLALDRSRKAHEKIVVLPDFDMDGISSGCILYAGLGLMGHDVELYCPDVTRGYGFDAFDIDAIIAKWPDAKAIITCDVGISCGEGVKRAKDLGLSIFVTDHHPEKNARVPADIVVDPSRVDDDCPTKGVCGAYVAYHLMTTYADLTGNEAVKTLMSKLVIFAMLGSCGDLMPVVRDTRRIIKSGLREFNALLDADGTEAYLNCSASALPVSYLAPFENLRSLHFSLLNKDAIHYGDVTDVDIGFTYCPMFNSVKRLGDDMYKLYDLLYTRRSRSDPDFQALVDWLVDLNALRKALVAETYAKLMDSDDISQPHAPYIYVSDCLPGLCGLLAMKIMTSTGLPCFVLNETSDGYVGSGRIPSWLHNSDIVYDNVKLEGHDNAFGVSISKDVFDEYAAHFKQTVSGILTAVSANTTDFRLVVKYDGNKSDCDFAINGVSDYDTCFDYAEEIEGLRPFGRGFEEPEHILRFSRGDVLEYKTMGKKQEHLRLTLKYNIRIVFFGGTSCYLDKIEKELDKNREYALSGRFSINEYNNNKSLQFMVSGIA